MWLRRIKKNMCTNINNHLHFSLPQVVPNDKWFYLLTLGIFGVYIVMWRKGNYMITQLNIEIKTSQDDLDSIDKLPFFYWNGCLYCNWSGHELSLLIKALVVARPDIWPPMGDSVSLDLNKKYWGWNVTDMVRPLLSPSTPITLQPK